MTQRRHSSRMFALAQPPAKQIELAGGRYELVRVFKHDFLAATCLYELREPSGPARGARCPARIVVKYNRTREFCGLPGEWVGELLCRHEEAIYAALAGVRGVPRWLGRLDKAAFAVEHIDGLPLDLLPAVPAGLFDRLRALLEAVHARGVGYCDANKRSNILVTPDGQPFLVDYQLSVRRRDRWPWPLRAIARAVVNYVAEKDIYHLCKHKRRLCPQELTPAERALSYRRAGLHLLHRKLTKPWRALRRRFLRRQYDKGLLRSPTAELEDQDQPEKATWRGREEDEP